MNAVAAFPRELDRTAIETHAVEGADVIVDALFGTGFHGEPRPEAAATIARINAAGAPVLSVDVPSELLGDVLGDLSRTVAGFDRIDRVSPREGSNSRVSWKIFPPDSSTST